MVNIPAACIHLGVRVMDMVLNANFNNISAYTWWSVLLMGKPEKTSDLPQVANKFYPIMYTSS
jgi:hypothetical protein